MFVEMFFGLRERDRDRQVERFNVLSQVLALTFPIG